MFLKKLWLVIVNNFTLSLILRIILALSFFSLSSYSYADTLEKGCDLFAENISKNLTKTQEHPLIKETNSHGIYVDEYYSYQNLLYISSINLNHSMSNAYQSENDDFLYHRFIRDNDNKKIIVQDYIYSINGHTIDLNKISDAQYNILPFWDERMIDPLISLEQIIEYGGIDGLDESDLDKEFIIGYIDYNIISDYYSLVTDEEPFIPKENELQYITIYPEEISGVKEIYIDLNISDIRELNEKNQQFKASYDFTSRWYDYGIFLELAENSFENDYWCSWNTKDPDFSTIEAIWNPNFKWINRLNYNKEENNEEIMFVFRAGYEYEDGYFPGSVEINYNLSGQANFPANFDYKSFPFDKQKIDVYLYNFDDVGYRGGAKNIWISTIGNLRGGIIVGDEVDLMSYINEANDHRFLPGWKLGEDNYNVRIQVSRDFSSYRSLFEEGEDGFLEPDEFSQLIKYSQNIEREWPYYIFKILTPIFLILVVCWSVFWTLPRELESRLTVTIVCFLALVAYNFVITEDLPQLPYMTLMDYIIIASYIYAALPTILSIVSHRFFEKSQLASFKVDRYAKLFGPPSYVLILYIIMHMQVTETNSINAIKLLTFN